MTNVLITGGAGYIGSRLVQTLKYSSLKVTVVDKLIFGQDSLVSAAGEIDFILEDAALPHKFKDKVKEADVIIPLAAIVGAPACDRDPHRAVETNVTAIKRLIDINPDAHYIYPNTNSGYGIGPTTKDGELLYCDESTPLNPISLYGRTKVQAEELVLGVGGTSLRLATVFGISPRPRLDLLLNDMVFRAWKDGFLVLYQSHFKRNFIHVGDVALAMEHVRLDKNSRGEIYNVGNSECNVSKLEMAQAIKEHVPHLVIKEEEFHKDPDQRNYIVSNAKLEDTGWAPAYSMHKGITEMLNAAPILDRARQKYSNI